MNLDDDPDTGSIYIGTGAVLDLNDALLSLTYVGDDFQWNTEYAIFETNGTGTVDGNFSGTSIENPAIVSEYNTQGTETSSDDTVSLAYQPTTSPSMVGLTHLVDTIFQAGNLVGQNTSNHFFLPKLTKANKGASQQYADSGTVVSDTPAYAPAATQIVYMTPYYSNTNRDDSPVGYNADTVGFVGGYELKNDNRLLGFHVGYAYTDLDFTGTGYSDNSEDMEFLSTGVHAMGAIEQWTWRGQVTGFYAMHDYEGLTGLDLDVNEDADYDTWGINAQAMGGYMLTCGEHRILPEVGLAYLWLSRESYTTDADEDAWDMHSSSLDEHQIFSVASLRWLTNHADRSG